MNGKIKRGGGIGSVAFVGSVRSGQQSGLLSTAVRQGVDGCGILSPKPCELWQEEDAVEADGTPMVMGRRKGRSGRRSRFCHYSLFLSRVKLCVGLPIFAMVLSSFLQQHNNQQADKMILQGRLGGRLGKGSTQEGGGMGWHFAFRCLETRLVWEAAGDGREGRGRRQPLTSCRLVADWPRQMADNWKMTYKRKEGAVVTPRTPRRSFPFCLGFLCSMKREFLIVFSSLFPFSPLRFCLAFAF